MIIESLLSDRAYIIGREKLMEVSETVSGFAKYCNYANIIEGRKWSMLGTRYNSFLLSISPESNKQMYTQTKISIKMNKQTRKMSH